ncbi:MAG: type II secretion system protein GspG [Kiritimatiellae bacterium]|nr:type II secretion system protein GspG [Kiritimatiellia bacterium]
MKTSRQVENVAAQGMRSGFTLIEILVAVAIIGILATGAVVGIPQLLAGSKVDAAAQNVQTLKNGVTAFQMRYPGKRFTDLKQLVEGDDDHPPIIDGGEDVLIDPWGNEYKYEVRGKRFAIISFGEDGEEGTEDDIRSDKVKSKAKER